MGDCRRRHQFVKLDRSSRTPQPIAEMAQRLAGTNMTPHAATAVRVGYRWATVGAISGWVVLVASRFLPATRLVRRRGLAVGRALSLWRLVVGVFDLARQRFATASRRAATS